MLFTEDQNMIQALAAERSDQAFNMWVLPGRPRCDRTVANPHPSHPVREGLSVGTIIVADQIARCRFPRECLGDLLRQPLRRRMLGHREPQKLSSTMAHDQKGKQALKRQGRNQTKVDRRNRVRMVAQECPPRLRWRSSVFDHVLGDGRLRDPRSQA
jgi:hypothetical protein